MSKVENKIIIGVYYETPNKKIAYTYGANQEGIIYRFDDDSGEHLVSKDDFFKWNLRDELKDFPNARDPRLPYVFDLNYDFKYTSDAISYLKKNPNDSELIELIANYAGDNLKLKKYIDIYNKNLTNFLKVKETIYELETKNFFYNIIEKSNIGCMIKRQEKTKINSDKADWNNLHITEILIDNKIFSRTYSEKEMYLESTNKCIKLIEKEEKRATLAKVNKNQKKL